MRGGKREGAGRPRHIESSTVGPKPVPDSFKTGLEFAMASINDPEMPIDVKVRLAIAVMPYQHAKLAEIAAGSKAAEAAAVEKAGKGRFAVPPAPRLVA
jgi:hypothetical protein